MNPGPVPELTIRQLSTAELERTEIAALRRLLDAAFGTDPEDGFSPDDWEHAIGGVHFVATRDGEIVAHASVVERELHVNGRPLRTGYVEAVATAPRLQKQGFGSAVMREVAELIRDRYELGALGTGSQGFYQRLGWEIWRGLSSVRTAKGELLTPDDDGCIMVLRTPSTPPIDLDEPISCELRSGDSW